MPTKRKKETSLKSELPEAGAFRRLTDFVRRIVAVPKHEADAKARPRQKRKHD